MTTWTCNSCGPVPAEQVHLIDHDSPHGEEIHDCGSRVVFDDWTSEGLEPA